jgi:hypothetical protein
VRVRHIKPLWPVGKIFHENSEIAERKRSFLKKRTKKLLHIGIELRQHRGLISKKFVGAPSADSRG